MEFRELGHEDAITAFSVLKQLRPHLSEADFLDIYHQAHTRDGYRLIAALEGDKVVGVVGYRHQTNFCHGKHIYVDDLVIAASHRSRGLGAELLKKVEQDARSHGVFFLRLDSGLAREKAHRFYEMQCWNKGSFSFRKELK